MIIGERFKMYGIKFGAVFFLCLLELSKAVPDFKFTINEEAGIGLDVGDLSTSATFYANMSAQEKASLRFGILDKNREPASLFTIGEQDGVLKVKSRIDREFLCDYSGSCVLEFDVAIHSQSSFSNIAGVEVTVLDINDNEPSFAANEVLLEISEGAKVGKEFKITGAADSDSLEKNKIQKYGLTLQGNIFSLTSTKNSDGSSVINLRLETPLDREKKNNYSFNIVATDGGNPPKSGTMRVKITVTDENDNPPVFTNNTYILNIKEDTPINFSVLKLKAIDLDVGQNGKVRYDFSPLQSAKGRSLFNIDQLSGDLTVAGDLSYEAGTSKDLYIVAFDGGSPPLKTQKKVRVNILDNGNNPPRVSMTTLSTGETDIMEIPESATVGFFVAFVEVEDSDPGQSGQFQCTTSNTSIFKLEIQAGKGYKVLLNTVLNRETQDSYDLRVTCTDQGEPPMSSTATLSLLVTDVNDKAPVFSHQIYNATLTENNNIGDFLVTVTATDDDIGVNAEIDYSIANDRRISVSSTGIISARSTFDRETDSKITFTVLATDRGSTPLVGSAQVVVNILDKNDNRPAFVRPFYQMDILENEVPGTSIGQIKAEDKDDLQNGQIEYFMAGSEGGVVPFEVLANGTVRSTKMLNREHDNKYTFTALARDKGSKPLTNSVDVIVTVKDINDNKPVVLFPTSGNHTVLISSFPESKSVIGKIIAYDEDSQENSKLHFSIVEGNDQGVFEIGDESGEIMVVNNWKLESNHIYDLTIKVRDSGNPVLFDTTKLRVEASFDNVTLGDAVAVKSDKYIVIAATVAGATCVLSLIIITAICLVLRGEKRKATAQPKQLDTVFDNVPVINGDKSPTHGLYGDVESDPRSRGFDASKMDVPGKKKEVSFSLDESTEAKDNLYHPRPNNIALSRAGLMPTHNLNLHNDDIHSDTSGETITSDSGRGGSEEEVNLQTINDKKHQWQAPVSSNRNSSFDQYYRDGSTGEYRNNSGQPRFLVANNNSANNNSSYRQDRSFSRPKSNSSYTTATSGRGTSQESFRDFSNPRTMLLPYNTQLSNMSHDDDASTTTSGSYTISPDEHFNDIVLQKDVIV